MRPLLLGMSPVAAVAKDHSSRPARSTLQCVKEGLGVYVYVCVCVCV